MNCPGHVQIFQHGLNSYRDLPLRLAEFGRLALRAVGRASRAPCGFAPSGRTMRTSSAPRSSSPPSVEDQRPDPFDLPVFGFDEVVVDLSTRPAKRVGTRDLGSRRGLHGQGADRSRRTSPGRISRQPGRGRLLRAQDRLPGRGLDGSLLAAQHVQLGPPSQALRAQVHRSQRRRAPARCTVHRAMLGSPSGSSPSW